MDFKQVFIQLNEESHFGLVRITRQLTEVEGRIDRQRSGLISAIKLDFGRTLPEFLKNLNDFYKNADIPLLSNSLVLLIHKKWRINRSIFSVLESLFVEIKPSGFLEQKDILEKVVHGIEIDPNSNSEFDKFKIWLTSRIIFKVYTNDSFERLEMFLHAIWKNYSSLYTAHVPDEFDAKVVDAHFKPIWTAFALFKRRKALPEIYFKFFNDFLLRLFDPVITEKKFLRFLGVFFQKNKLEIVRAYSYDDYLRLYELQQLNEPLFNKIPDLSKTDVAYGYKDGSFPQSTCFYQVFELLSGYGISYFFIVNFFSKSHTGQEKEWFCDLVRGGNLVDSKNLPFTLTKKVAHFFNILPEDVRSNPQQDLLQSIKSHYGISNQNYSLTQSLIYCAIYFDVRDAEYTQEVMRNLRRTDNLDFWMRTLCLLYHKGLRQHELNQVIDYIDDQVIRNGRKINFNTKKLTNLLNEVHFWHEELMLMRIGSYKRTYYLPKSDIKAFKVEYKNNSYSIIQLLTNKELIEEGRSLRHCVGTYTENCIDRGSFIFSLRLEEAENVFVPLITIEVIDKTIRQKRGRANRNCLKEEEFIIREWAKENELKYI